MDYISNIGQQTTDKLSNLAIKLLEIKEGDAVADLCCSDGSYLCQVASLFSDAALYGSDINIDCCTNAQERLNKLQANFKIECKNMFDVDINRKFDKIFIHPPFGLTPRKDENSKKFFDNQFFNTGASTNTSVELMCVKLATALLTQNGKAVVVAPISTTFKQVDKALRESIVSSNCLGSVITLPKGMFTSTSAVGVAYVIKRNTNKTKLTDGSNSTCVDSKTIKDHKYDLQLKTYLQKPITFKNSIALGKVCLDILRTGSSRVHSSRQTSTNNRDIYSVKIANMEDGLVILSKTPETELLKASCGIRLQKKDILLSKVTSTVKASIYVHENNTEAYAQDNIYVLRVNEQVIDPYYLCAFFNSDIGSEMIEQKGVGSRMPVISVKNLRELEIPLPHLDAQHQIARQFKTRCSKIKRLKEELEIEQKK